MTQPAPRYTEAAFPFCDDLSTISAAGFVPHMSVGQWPDEEAAKRACKELQEGW